MRPEGAHGRGLLHRRDQRNLRRRHRRGGPRASKGARTCEVDGIVGGRTATTLGIWPGDESFVVHTPPPAAGATDSWGATLSSVATTGDDAPPMPADSGQGTGKRVVYDRAGQRVWAVDDQERVVRSYLVTGSQYNNELPGRHEVYSKLRAVDRRGTARPICR